MARSILSFGMFWARAAWIAPLSRGFMAGSGRPIFAAAVISRASLEKSFERFLSWAPLRNWMFLNFEWPAMACNRFLTVGVVMAATYRREGPQNPAEPGFGPTNCDL